MDRRSFIIKTSTGLCALTILTKGNDMKPKVLRYERLISGPGYNNRKCGIEFEIEDGDDLNHVFSIARDFVD